MICPVNRIFIIRGFKNTGLKRHYGVDFGWNIESDKHQPVYACDAGVVIYNRKQVSGGYTIVIKHDNGLCSVYGHLQKDSQKVHEGYKVKKGQQIANMGNSGLNTTGCHLHFAIYKGTKVSWDKKIYLDPLKYINVYVNQYVGDGTMSRYKLLFTKIANGIPSEPLLVHNKPYYSEESIVKGMDIYNGNEVETYGEVNNGKSILNIIDNVRGYYCSNKYLQKQKRMV